MKPRHLLLPVLLAYSIPASANGYLGLSFGSSSVKADLTSLGGGSIDESTGMNKFYGGYRFNEYVAAELAWYNLASVSVAHTPAATASCPTLRWTKPPIAAVMTNSSIFSSKLRILSMMV